MLLFLLSYFVDCYNVMHIAKMSVTLVQLSLLVITVIQLTSSQSTYDVIQQDSGVSSCVSNDQVLRQLVTTVSQLTSAVSRLQRDVSELKTNLI